jgi:ABC-2 type transport system ATP-binding protein
VSESAPRDLLTLDHITRRFGEYLALNDVVLNLPPGRIGLLGPNAAGKSTLLKIILGLLPPTSGTGQILGEPISVHRSHDAGRRLRYRIGFMPEAEALVPGLTGVEYVALAGELCGMPRRQAERRAHEVLTFLRLDEARYRTVEQYSAGMKQRVKLAQALVHDPELILLDEPTSGLDPSGRDAMLALIRELGTDHGKSIILSTHLLADVQEVCDRVVIMANGTIRGQGLVNELCARRDDRWRVRFQGDLVAIKQALINQHVEILGESPNGEWKLRVPADWSASQFFVIANRHQGIVRSMMRDDETLEELFVRFLK